MHRRVQLLDKGTSDICLEKWPGRRAESHEASSLHFGSSHAVLGWEYLGVLSPQPLSKPLSAAAASCGSDAWGIPD